MCAGTAGLLMKYLIAPGTQSIQANHSVFVHPSSFIHFEFKKPLEFCFFIILSYTLHKTSFDNE